MRYILAFDPGGTTGWAFGGYSDESALSFIGGGQIEDGLHGFIYWFEQPEAFAGNITIVSESFQLRASVRNPDVTPLRIEGALEALLGPGRVVYQQPALKSTVGDQLLKDNGLWIPGQRHQMDARIHAIAYLKKNRHLPTIRAFWPEKED